MEKDPYLHVMVLYSVRKNRNACQVKALTHFQENSHVRYSPAQHFTFTASINHVWAAFEPQYPLRGSHNAAALSLSLVLSSPVSIVLNPDLCFLPSIIPSLPSFEDGSHQFPKRNNKARVYPFPGNALNNDDHLRNATENWSLQSSEQLVHIGEEQLPLGLRTGTEKKEHNCIHLCSLLHLNIQIHRL